MGKAHRAYWYQLKHLQAFIRAEAMELFSKQLDKCHMYTDSQLGDALNGFMRLIQGKLYKEMVSCDDCKNKIECELMPPAESWTNDGEGYPDNRCFNKQLTLKLTNKYKVLTHEENCFACRKDAYGQGGEYSVHNWEKSYGYAYWGKVKYDKDLKGFLEKYEKEFTTEEEDKQKAKEAR